jgi:hypothetical protein
MKGELNLMYQDETVTEDQIKTISTQDFITEMERQWVERLNNVSNPKLRQTWKQLIKTFNFHINNHHIPDRAKEWTVCSPPTGSGKTQSLILMSAMLANSTQEEHPAILIITRRKEDCNSIRDQINWLGRDQFGATRDTAIAYHGDTKATKSYPDGVRLSHLKSHPVAVITHSAYQKALDNLGHENFKSDTWSYFLSYDRRGKLPESLEGQRETKDNHVFSQKRTSSRRLIVIDECLDIINQYEVTLDRLKNLKTMLPEDVQNKFAFELMAINDVLDTLQELTDNKRKLADINPEVTISERMFIRESIEDRIPDGEIKPPDFSGLIAELKGINPDQIIGVSCPSLNAPVRNVLEKTLRSLDQLYKNWSYYANSGKGSDGFHTSKLIVPDGLKGCVVMDATANTSILYDIHKDSVRLQAPKGSRSYKNVTLHVSSGHKVGKWHLTNEYKSINYARELIGDMNVRLKGRKSLIVCHKGIEDQINSFKTTFDMSTAHWGELDGSNKYRDHDSVVIFGLNFRQKTWASNVFFACQGIPEDDRWFKDKRKRTFKHLEDVRRDLEDAQIAVDTIQAINRVRCRQTIDSEGNCKPTDVYLLLPQKTQAKTILKYIVRAMPNVNVVFDFNYNSVKRKAKESNHENGLCTYLKNQPKGEYTKKNIISRKKMSTATFERLIAKAKSDPDCKLAQTMVEHNVTYHVTGKGRKIRSFFLKH